MLRCRVANVHKLRIGFFVKFKGADTILFEGDPEGIEKLATVCTQLAMGAIQRVDLHALPFVARQRGLQITTNTGSKSIGVRRSESDALRFHWTLSKEDWQDVAWRLQALQAGNGHQYLGDYLGTSDPIQLIASTGEYDQSFWQSLG